MKPYLDAERILTDAARRYYADGGNGGDVIAVLLSHAKDHVQQAFRDYLAS